MISSDGRERSCITNMALIIGVVNPDIAALSPACSPTIFNDPVVPHRCIKTDSHQQNSMVNGGIVSTPT